MSKIAYSEIQYGAFGRCMRLTNGLLELVVTLDIGPRIIRLAMVGGENMMAELPEKEEPANGWKIWGGHRLWTSPEAMPRTYELDNDPIEYEMIEDGILLRHPRDPISGMIKEIEITMDEETTVVDVLHRVTNDNAWPVEFADWAITVMDKGGKLVAPFNTTDTGYLANRQMAIWPYSKMNDKRFWMGERFVTLQQETVCDGPFKIGMDNEQGWVACFNHGCVFIKHFLYDEDAVYPDGGMSFETYTCEDFIEVETLSPMETVAPGETLEHFECWELLPGVEMPANDDEVLAAFAEETIASLEDCGCGDCDDEDCGCGCDHDHEGCGGHGHGGCGGHDHDGCGHGHGCGGHGHGGCGHDH